MNYFLLTCLLLFSLSSNINVMAQNPEETKLEDGFDQELALKYGADDYGMCKYVMAFLKVGPNRDQSQEAAQALQAAHMANIGRLAKEGKLVVAGPFLDEGDIRGIYIFDVTTIQEAEVLTATDPAIQAGSLIMELHPWYGSAGLKSLNELHGKLQKVKF